MDLTKILEFTLLLAIVVRSEAQATEITRPNANEVIINTSVTTTETTTTIQELEGVFRLIQTIKTSWKGQISKKKHRKEHGTQAQAKRYISTRH